MADFIKNNADLIKDILTVVGAAIPLVLSIITLLRSRDIPTSAPIDSPSMKIMKIKRYALDKNEWKAFSSRMRFYTVFFILVFVGYYTFVIGSFLRRDIILNIIGILVFIATLYLLILLIKAMLSDIYVFLFMKSGTEAEYYIFNNIEILIYSEYHYLFNKCHEVLRKMKFIVVEVDEKMGFIRVEKRKSLNTRRVLTVQIENSECGNKEELIIDKDSIYQIRLVFSETHREEPLSLDLSADKSKVTNHFINALISKPKDK